MPWLNFTQYLGNYVVLLGTKSKQAHAYLKIYSMTLSVKRHSQLDPLCLRYQRYLRYNKDLRSKLPCISFERNAVGTHTHTLAFHKKKKKTNKKNPTQDPQQINTKKLKTQPVFLSSLTPGSPPISPALSLL